MADFVSDSNLTPFSARMLGTSLSIAIEEAYAATCYVSEHADEFGVDRHALQSLATAWAATWQPSYHSLQSKGLVLK
jgi:hypothetical protein